MTGFESDVAVFDDAAGPDELLAAGLFSGDLAAAGVDDDVDVDVDADVDFGRFLGGLFVEGDVAGFSLGREVRNAPRTSSSCGGGTATTIAAQIRTKPKSIALNRIYEISLSGGRVRALVVLNTDVKDYGIAGLVRRHFDAH